MSLGNDNPNIDRAEWKRFASKGGRCLVCGHVAVVSLSISSKELTGARGGPLLANDTVQLCQEHGVARYAAIAMQLRGVTKL